MQKLLFKHERNYIGQSVERLITRVATARSKTSYSNNYYWLSGELATEASEKEDSYLFTRGQPGEEFLINSNKSSPLDSISAKRRHKWKSRDCRQKNQAK